MATTAGLGSFRNVARTPTASMLVLVLLTAACGQREDKEAEARRAVAMVEAAQNRKPPVEGLRPQPITFGEVQRNRISRKGCAFLPSGGEDGNPVLYADHDRAVMKISSQFEVFASDSGSAEGPGRTRHHYTGKTWDMRLEPQAGAGLPLGEDSVTWNAALTLRDRFDRPVYAAAGTLVCPKAPVSAPG